MGTWLPGPGPTGGDDVFIGNSTNEVASGGAGNDDINGGGGLDTLIGGAGDDFLDGGDGDDGLAGESGNDVIVGGAGADIILGGDGDDAIAPGSSLGPGSPVPRQGTSVNGEGGFDLISFFDAPGAVTVDLNISEPQSIRGNWTGLVRISNVEGIQGSEFGDRLALASTAAVEFGGGFVDGLGGDDEIIGGDGADLIIGGAGSDNVVGNAGDDLLLGEAGGDFLFGDDGADILDGGDGDDHLSGGASIDQLFGGAGIDTLTGGDGDDTLIGDAGADALDGGAGLADVADYSASLVGVIVSLGLGTGASGDAAGDTLTGVENLRGSSVADTLSGDAGSNVLFGGAGADQILGGDGADVLQGEADGDTLDGEAGADQLAGGDGDDVLIGGAGADILGGGAGIDTADYSTSLAGVVVNLQTGTASGGDAAGDTFVSVENVTGSVLNDTLIGRDFVVNVLIGGGGDDTLSGGVAADAMHGGTGIDTLDYSLSPNGVDVRLFSGAAAGGSANGDTYSSIENIIGAATKTDTLAGDANANSIWGGGGNETITGRENTDTLFGEAGNDTLLGGADSDILIGGIGADTLGGGSQDDTADYSASDAGVTVNLQTGAGSGGHAQGDVLVSIEDVIGSAFNDVIIGKNNVWDNVFDGRGGNDTYTGGLGNDVFVFRLNEGSDTITDFVAGGAADAVQLAGFGAGFDSFAEVIAAATQVGADTIIDFGAGQTLTLQNVTLANLNAGDFIFG